MTFLANFHRVKKFIRTHGLDIVYGALIFSQMFTNPFAALCFVLSYYYYFAAKNSLPPYITGNLSRVHLLLQYLAAIVSLTTGLLGLSLLIMPIPLIFPALFTPPSWVVGLGALLGAGIAYYAGPIIRRRFYHPDFQKTCDKLLKSEKHYNDFIKGVANQNLPDYFELNAIKNGQSLLDVAISKQNIIAVRELIQRGVQIGPDVMINAVFNAQVVEGGPRFDAACQIIKLLAERKVDIECKGEDGITLLEECIDKDHKSIANILLNLGADLSKMSPVGQATFSTKLADLTWRKIFFDHYKALSELGFPTRSLKDLAAKVAFSHFKDGHKVKCKSPEEILPQDNLLLFYKNTPQREERYNYANYSTFQFYKNNLLLTKDEKNQFKRTSSLRGT